MTTTQLAAQKAGIAANRISQCWRVNNGFLAKVYMPGDPEVDVPETDELWAIRSDGETDRWPMAAWSSALRSLL